MLQPILKALRATSLVGAGLLPASALSGDYRVDGVVEFSGMCDASGAVPVSGTHFIVADDEDNLLRMYHAQMGGNPIASYALSVLPGGEHITSTHVKENDQDEFDLESATRIGDTLYWLTSHGRDKKGRAQPERYQFIVVTRNPVTGEITPTGKPYTALLNDIIASPKLPDYPWQRYAKRPAKASDAINIEGMTAALDEGLWIGFRNPVIKGKSILVKVNNPEEVAQGEQAQVTEAIQLDLDGLGVRGLTSWNGHYYIAAGPIDEGRESKLFKWRPGQAPQYLNIEAPEDFNPEGFFTPEDGNRFLVLSDDGSREIHGKSCKKLEDSAQKKFRGVWVKPENEKS